MRARVELLESLFCLMKTAIPVPDSSTLCRRRKRVAIDPLASLPKGRLHLVVDASGFKVYGEGEWKVRQHEWSKRRAWRKLHLGVDVATGEIIAATASTNNFRDDELMSDLLEQIPEEIPMTQVSGDGIYDSHRCYSLLQERAVRAAIPPHCAARLRSGSELAQRNANIKRIAELSGERRDGRKK